MTNHMVGVFYFKNGYMIGLFIDKAGICKVSAKIEKGQTRRDGASFRREQGYQGGCKLNIYLIGFMGTGKSTLGRVLSQRIGWPWIDTDQEIVKRQNRTIPEIFASEGEAYFRDRETELLKELALRKRILVTTGGGMVLRSENRELMRKSGIVISLTADRNVIRDRVARQGNRPLLAGDELEQRIDRLLKERAELYNEADIQIDTTSGDIDAAVRELLANPAFPLR